MSFTFRKEERLKHKKLIEKLFKKGHVLKVFPLKLIYLQLEHKGNYPIKIGFSVPKKIVKLAVNRNRIKRQLGESYRLNKPEIYKLLNKKYVMMIIFTGNKKYDSHLLDLKMTHVFQEFIKKQL
jgi:ribonuclease P protein component